MIANLNIDNLEQNLSQFNSHCFERKRESILQRIINDAIGYLYKPDPNFDFDNRNVESDTNYRTSHNKHKIKRYYEEPELEEESKNLSTSLKYDTPAHEPLSPPISKLKRFSDNTHKKPRRKVCSDYNLTKCMDSAIAPDKMKARPKYTLKEVCENNNYELSYTDFEDNKVVLGNGAFGDVFLV